MRNKATSEASSTGGSRRSPAISATTSVDPNGVFVTPTRMAAISAAIATSRCTPMTVWLAAPSAAPTKKSGMMNPPRQPDDRIIDDATSLTNAPTRSVAAASFAVEAMVCT